MDRRSRKGGAGPDSACTAGADQNMSGVSTPPLRHAVERKALLLSRIGAAVAVGTAVVIGVSPALAATGWTIVPTPPTGQNAAFTAVTTTSDSSAWAVGSENAELSGVGAKALIDHWNGAAWSQGATPATPGNTASLAAVSASSTTDAWAVGRTQVNWEDFEPLALHWNGTAWSVSSSAATALAGSSNVNAFFPFNSIQVNSPTDVWAVGDQGVTDSSSSTLIEHWGGKAWSIVPSPAPGSGSDLTGVTTSNTANDVWAVGYYDPTGTAQGQTLTLNWNGTKWVTAASPNASSGFSVLDSVATTPGAPIVQAVSDSGACGDSGDSGATNPLALQNG